MKNNNNKTEKQEAKEFTLKTVEEMQAVLNAQIEKFQKINTLINQRGMFSEKKRLLEFALIELEQEDSKGSFESEKFSFNFISGRYNREDTFKITNPFMIKEIMNYIVLKIDAKVLEIENELITAN